MKKIILLLLLLFSNTCLNAQIKILESKNSIKVFDSNFENSIDNSTSYIIGVDQFDESRLSVKIYESKSTTTLKNTEYKNKATFNFEYIGIKRGLKLASVDFDLNRIDPLTNQSYRIDSIKFEYKFNKELNLNKASASISFPNVINSKQIGSLIIQKDSKIANQTQSTNEWFQPNLDYYKFYSQKDGIARINHSELLKFNSSLNGKDIKNIQIFNRGQKIKFYSTNNTIGSDNYLYFVATHAYGDTSYYDFYNGKEPYFLTFNPNDISTTYELIDNNLKGQSVSEVEIDNHYEKDRVYGNGVNVVDTETSLCENWYFEELRVQNNFNHPWEFFTDFSLFPTSDLKIQYEYASNIFYLPLTIYNKTLMNINTQRYDTISNIGSGIINREINVSKFNLLQGGNTLNMNSYRVVDDQAKNDFNGIIGFDYYKIKGNVRPITDNGYFSFLSDNNVNANVTVSGFPDNLIIAIDTTNNTIQFPNSKNVNILSLDSKDKYSSIFYNSQLLTSHFYGYHIVTDLNGSKISKDFKNENEFISYLDAIDVSKDNAVIINLETTITSKLKSKIQEKLKSILIIDATNKFLYSSIGSNIYESNNSSIFENINVGNYYQAFISLLTGEKSRKIVNSKTTLQEVTLIPSKIKKIDEGDYDAFYVYHPDFKPSIDKYIDYMSEKTNKKLLKLDVEQLYDTYGYGIESPHSIKNFFQVSYDNWKKFPEFLTLVGDGTWDPKMQRFGSFVKQLIPTYGIPYTDNFYGTLDGDDIVPELVIGRIPVNTNQELENYLDKVKTFNNVPLNPWMKTVLQIAGGDDGQKDSFKETMEFLNGLFAKSELAFDTITISRASDNVINEAQADEIKKEINEGKMWVNFLGHGSPSVIDMSGWEAPNLNNQGKYGVLNTLSCNTSAFAEPSQVNSIGEEFVNVKEKGFIACIGGTSTTEVSRALTISNSIFFTLLHKERPERNIGRIFDSFKARNNKSPDAVNQVVLLGDPLIDLRIAKQPELILNNKDIKIKNENFSTILTENNKTANIEIKFYNLGTRTTDSVNFRLIHTFNNTNDTIIKRISEVLFDKIVSFDINIENAVGEHRLSLFADNDSLINDINYTNNQTNLVFNVFAEGLIPLEPLDNWDVSATKPVFRFVNPTNTQKLYNFAILDNEEKVVFNTTSPLIFENYIEVTTSVLKPNQKYTIEYSTQEILSGVQSATNKIDFHSLSTIDSIVHYKVDAVSSGIQTKNLKVEDNKLKFDDKVFGVKLSSARGSENAERHSIINTYDQSNENALFSYVVRLRRGFNIVVIPDELDDSTFTNLQFDTWETRFNDPDRLKDSRLLDEYLSDSLKKGDYLLLATADVPMRAPDEINDRIGPDSIGSSTRIKKILNNLGAKFADSLEFNSSYVLFTRIGYPGSTIDRHTLGDTIQLTSELTRFQTEANIKISNIGNAKKLIQSNIGLNSENTTINSKLINKNLDTVFTFEGINSDLSEFDAQQNPNFDILTNIKRDSIGAPFELSKFTLDFIPEPELAVVKSKTNTDINEYERGFNALYNYQIENISTRSDAKNLETLLTLENNFKPDSVLKVVEFLPKNTSFSDSKVYETINAATQNSILTSIDPYAKVNELFLFNNTSENDFRVKEDTTKPWLIAYADNIEIIENNFVSEKPVFIIELYDKSPQLIVKDNVILARVNRKIMLNNTTDTFNFEIINNGELKARMTFSPNFLLDIGENTLFVIGEDATGNHADTLDLKILVSSEYKSNSLINYPNPFEQSSTFKFNYIGRDTDGEVQINIFNAIGSKVRKLNREVNFGVNEMLWDGKDDYGNSISSGVYFYRLDIVNKPSEPVFGKMIKVN